MPFDQSLAARIRDALAGKKNIEEKKMFGCICFFLNGNALTGVWKDRLIARLGPDEAEAALLELHVRAFDITGRPMRKWVAVEPDGVEDDDKLKEWVERAMKFVETLLAEKESGTRKNRAKRILRRPCSTTLPNRGRSRSIHRPTVRIDWLRPRGVADRHQRPGVA